MNEYKLQRAAAEQVKDTDTDTNCRHNNRYKTEGRGRVPQLRPCLSTSHLDFNQFLLNKCYSKPRLSL